jgi:hemoglobin
MLPGPPPLTKHPWGDRETPYLQLGGDEAVRELVETFYDVIEEDSPVLRAMLPANTSGTRQKLYEYMSGWLGGPPLYTDKRGHPRLRMRHAPFGIGVSEAQEWMRCMRVSIDRVGVTDPLRAFLDEKLDPLAQHMINQ